MPDNWEEFLSELDELVSQAGKRTDDRLAGRLSGVTHLTDTEICQLFPEPSDAKKVGELMAMVKKAGAENEKVNELVGNIEDFAGVIVKLLRTFA